MVRSSLIKNKSARKDVYAAERKQKNADKLRRRMDQRKAELEDPSLRVERLRTNIPTTIENSKEWVGEGFRGHDGQIDRRTMPVQLLATQDEDGAVVGQNSEMKLDMAGLEDLFPDEEPLRMGPIASTSAEDPEAPAQIADGETDEPQAAPEPQERGKVLITTAPHPSDQTIAFANEFASLLGGPNFSQIVPRRTARFELSKVCRWAAKRGYNALIVIGEDHTEPSSMTISKLPLGPSAHFRLTSVYLSKEIDGHGKPTSHAPELVLSNMATPLGLSIGRLLGALFPPLPQIQGRQVVAVHNQRDYIFIRRYRYMFDVRGDDELTQRRAKDRGMDATVKTRMQEIGPRLTLRLRWLKRGTLETGRRKAGGQTIGEVPSKMGDEQEAQITEFDAETQTADAVNGVEETTDPTGGEPAAPVDEPKPKRDPKRRAKPRTHSSGGGIRIPKLGITEDQQADARNDFRRKKRKAGDSILDGVFLQGGMKDESLEWQWNPRMSLKKRTHFL